MSHRHEGIDEDTQGICRPLPPDKLSATILPDCAQRARWRCRQCRRLLAGDTLIVRAEGRQIALAQLAITPSPMLTMAALTCPRCGSSRIAMTGEN
jgi:hypothetical protein